LHPEKFELLTPPVVINFDSAEGCEYTSRHSR
jgi:hypothetical protein